MDYRIVELCEGAGGAPDSVEGLVEIDRFESAYHAVEAMRRAYSRGVAGVDRWCLVDGAGRMLFGYDDLVELACESQELAA